MKMYVQIAAPCDNDEWTEIYKLNKRKKKKKCF